MYCLTQTGELCQPNSPNIGAETIFEKYSPIPCTLYSGINSESGWGQEWAFRLGGEGPNAILLLQRNVTVIIAYAEMRNNLTS